MAENRRVKMTKRLIKDSYIDLMVSEPHRRPSVTDICNSADVNRSTFYTHYKSFDDLYAEVEDDLFSHIPILSSPLDPDTDQDNCQKLQEFFVFIKENPRMFSLLVSTGKSKSWERKLAGHMFQKYPWRGLDSSENEYSRYYTYVYCVMGALSVVREWHRRGCQIDPEMLAYMVYQYANAIIDFTPDTSGFKPLSEY